MGLKMNQNGIEEEYVVWFQDGGFTYLFVLEDETVQDAVVDLCEREGWDVDEIMSIELIQE